MRQLVLWNKCWWVYSSARGFLDSRMDGGVSKLRLWTLPLFFTVTYCHFMASVDLWGKSYVELEKPPSHRPCSPSRVCCFLLCWAMRVSTCQNTRYMVHIDLNCVHLAYLLGFPFRILCRTLLHQATQYLRGILVANLVFKFLTVCIYSRLWWSRPGWGLRWFGYQSWFLSFHLSLVTFENLCFI